MKPSIKHPLFSSALFLTAALPALATEITFESPYTTTGDFSTGINVTTAALFNGQQNWSQSYSNSLGKIITTTTSGSYTGGQALSAPTAGATLTYMGATQAIAPTSSYQFDFRYYNAAEVGVGGWDDTNTDGKSAQAEAGFTAGNVAVSNSASAFGIRGTGFLGTGGTYLGRFSTGTSGVDGNWYRMIVMPDSTTNQVSLSVYDLTTGAAVPLTTSLINFTAAEFGVATSSYDGLTARVTATSTKTSALDNIKTSLNLSGSIFEWNLDNPETDTGSGASNGGAYHKVTNNDAVTGSGATFNLKLATGDAYSEAFWDTNKSWSDIFTGTGTVDLQSLFSTFGGTGVATDGTVTGEGKFAFTGNTLNWTAVTATNTYANWLSANSPATGFSTDTDNDGVPNGVENVLGTNPNTSSAGLTEVSATASTATFKHTLNPTLASDVTYTYEWSTDLAEWKASGETNTVTTTATITPSAPVSGVVTVTTAITSGPAAKLFTRIKASQP